jgi:hypothetical protein
MLSPNQQNTKLVGKGYVQRSELGTTVLAVQHHCSDVMVDAKPELPLLSSTAASRYELQH